MSKYTFLFRMNEDNRDCCGYVELDRLGKLECGHYFPGLNISGAAYSGKEFPAYSDIETALTEAEYNQFVEYNKAISLFHGLGCNIVEGDERYLRGVALTDAIQDIIDKLLGEENETFFEQIQEEEIEVITDEHDLSEDEVREVFDYSPYGYKDRGLICHVYEDEEDLGREYAESCDSIPKHLETYIDYESYGSDIADNEEYYKLDDGRIVKIYM